ncbi:hypothetical protein ACH33_08555 [Aneurinibacillus sp. XH2]|uniref:hypothetical protein n=1 Tax=Aneurinibacillus sp. XH2 TaxID=1450761 RepID=UPI00070F54AB|nr:hypothetical protein [Aneurinibacillus sp. XH2]AMA72902.1 hypothetical protein ACH33_08555 [Aneurinibacillus sp. XH2]
MKEGCREVSWNMRLQEVLEQTAEYDMSLMDSEQNQAYQQRLELNRILLEMEEAKQEADEFLKLADAYKAAGEEKGYQAAWAYHKLSMKHYHDLSHYYTKTAAMCANT